jgi:hypothetical protein
LHHRLMSNVPSGQVAAFPALTLEMRHGSRRFEVEDFAKQIPPQRGVPTTRNQMVQHLLNKLPTHLWKQL